MPVEAFQRRAEAKFKRDLKNDPDWKKLPTTIQRFIINFFRPDTELFGRLDRMSVETDIAIKESEEIPRAEKVLGKNMPKLD